ncbi:GNAT family N-acetyltransferase [Micromonospora sp. PTRAS2]|uniref:GNAT family N-acetyltransferase n=1 Tax=unclassified Micromonospora TaxID=2617518 RepID=UPI0026C38EEC|nr:GNAT family N-acetyltransferase [Micromonospora sp. DH13]
MSPQTVEARIASFAELDARTLHDLLRLRVDVFVVEQRCPYPELDGRDVEPGTRHVWLTRAADGGGRTEGDVDSAAGGDAENEGDGTGDGNDGGADSYGGVVAYLRILADPGGLARIGRVVVAPGARGGGHAGRLMTEALAAVGDRPCVLEAQSHLVGFYARHGFAVSGPEYVEDGIPHTPMRRHPARPDAPEGAAN